MNTKVSVKTAALIVVAALVLPACGGADGMVQSQVVPTGTAVPSEMTPTPVSVATPKLVATPEPEATPLSALPSNPNLGSDWEGSYEETGVAIGAENTYSHFPQGYIRYDEVVVDDELVAVSFVCYEQPHDITDIFAVLSEPGEIPVRYKSWDIQEKPGCHVEFTVRNTEGDTMGLSFKAHCPICK